MRLTPIEPQAADTAMRFLFHAEGQTRSAAERHSDATRRKSCHGSICYA
jgi:hypothetical protein